MTLNVVVHKILWTRIAGMEGLEEYVEEGSPLNEQSNSRKEPVKEEITNNLNWNYYKQLKI